MIPLQDVPVMVLHVVNSDIWSNKLQNIKHDPVTRRPCNGFASSDIWSHKITVKHDSVTRRPCDGFASSDI